MKLRSKNNLYTEVIIPALFVYMWLSNTAKTDSFHNVYVLCALLGVLCIFDNYKHRICVSRRVNVTAGVLGAVFAVATVVANYFLFEPIYSLLNWFNIVCSLAGGFFLAYHVLLCGINRLPLSINTDTVRRKHSVVFFLLCWGSIGGVFLLYLFFTAYPGYLTTDSINSLTQIRTGVYLNNNPYWYTVLIRFFIQLGEGLFRDINAAVACYSTSQILILSACFAYGLVTLYQAGIPMWCIAATYVVYTFLPYNLAYSVTMWKDILFGASALLIVASLYRILKKIGRSGLLNYLVFVIGAIGFCLMRTNGWYAYLVTSVLVWLLYWRRNRRLCIVMLVVLILCWILINPVLSALNVGETDFVETLSVPLQQIARVIANGCLLAPEDEAFLAQIFDLKLVAERYSPEIVDPIKFETFQWTGKDFLKDNFGEFIRVWLRIGVQYPGEYLKAWVELTKGFWNGGYYFWIYLTTTFPDTSGIGGFVMDNPINDLFAALFRYMEKPVILRPLYSIGLHAWIVVACCFVCAAKKRREFILTIPVLVLLAGLWIGTPVYAEYRYAYPMFTSCPIILLASMFSGESLCNGKCGAEHTMQVPEQEVI